MVCHGLGPRPIGRECRIGKIESLGQVTAQCWRNDKPALKPARERYAGMPQKSELHGDTETVGTITPIPDQGEIVALECVEPDQSVMLRWTMIEPAALAVSQQSAPVYPGLHTRPQKGVLRF